MILNILHFHRFFFQFGGRHNAWSVVAMDKKLGRSTSANGAAYKLLQINNNVHISLHEKFI